MRIDSHQHFWNYDPAKHVWMNEKMGVLKKDFHPYDLEPFLKKCNIDACIAVQANQAELENDFLLDLANKNDIIKGIVGWVDLKSENLLERLEYYSEISKIKGFRHVIHDEPDLDFMVQPSFMKGISELKKYSYTYDILIFAAHLPNTIKFVKNFPDQAFIIDHIAKPNIAKEEIETWQKHLKEVARFENVYCKISGMVTEADWLNWQKEDFTKYLDAVVNAFGTKRIVYGSDWPVCTLAATYEKQYTIVKEYFSTFSPNEQDLFFGGNATHFYSL